jgi:arylsulfatase A-like enzyme
MRKFIKILGLGIGAANIPAFASAQQVKPNILWIIADDLGTDLACYGNKSVKTPNTDKLAAEGITFTGLFSVTAVSSPSRSSLMTGMYPVSINCHQHRTLKKMPLPEGILPVTDYFRKAGYWVANGDGTRFGRAGKTDFNFEFQVKTLFDGPDWTGRKQNQPFFVQMQIHFPHRPFETDKLNPIDPQSVIIPPVYPDHPVTRADWVQYLESVQHADEIVGNIMERLEKVGLLDNTIVMFFGDQGRPMVRAKQFVYDEGTNTPMIIRFPDKRGAGTKVNDLISNIDIPATSLALAGIGLPEKMQGRNIFSKKKRDYVFISRDRMDETVDRIRAVRSGRFKYIRNYYPDRPYTQFNTYKVTMYPVLTLMKVLNKRGELNPVQTIFMGPGKEKEELYDLKSDPFEMKNLATDPAYSKDLKKLRKALDKWVAVADKGLYPESVAETDHWKEDASKAYIQKMKSYGLPADISDEDYLKWWERSLLNN